jgi:hypothetical protein
MSTGSYYSIRPRRIGKYASTLEASWALHLRPMCDDIEYVGATHSSCDFVVTSAGREIAVEIKPQRAGYHTDCDRLPGDCAVVSGVE